METPFLKNICSPDLFEIGTFIFFNNLSINKSGISKAPHVSWPSSKNTLFSKIFCKSFLFFFRNKSSFLISNNCFFFYLYICWCYYIFAIYTYCSCILPLIWFKFYSRTFMWTLNFLNRFSIWIPNIQLYTFINISTDLNWLIINKWSFIIIFNW